jgi:hypothetical protein
MRELYGGFQENDFLAEAENGLHHFSCNLALNASGELRAPRKIKKTLDCGMMPIMIA